MSKQVSIENILNDLKERAKELNCIYNIEETLKDFDLPLKQVLAALPDIILTGWQYPEQTSVLIHHDDLNYTSRNFSESKWFQVSDIYIDKKLDGYIKVFYKSEFSDSDEGPFMKEERKLLDTISSKIDSIFSTKTLKHSFPLTAIMKMLLLKVQAKRNGKLSLTCLKKQIETFIF